MSRIESFLPLVKKVKQWSDRKKKITVPLFPSYLFVNLKGQKDIETVLAIKESFFFVKNGKDYAIARKNEIENIKLLLGLKDIEDINIECLSKIKIGDTCTITSGLMCGLSCQVLDLPNKTRIRVLVQSLNQCINATIPLSYLLPIL